MGLENLGKSWRLIAGWAVILGLIASLLADWERWDRFPINLLWRALIVALGGVMGLVFDHFASFYVGMGTNVIESMGVTKFGSDTHQKIRNSFIFVLSLVAAILAFIFIR